MLTPAAIYSTAAPYVARLMAAQVKADQFLQVGNGSGFMVAGKMVTCAHNLKKPIGAQLHAIFPKASWYEGGCAAWTYPDPLPTKAFSEEHSYDYAVLDALQDDVKIGLKFSDREPCPGEPVCSIGYAFDGTTQIMHQGIIAGVEKSGVATMLTLDMSVNPGNSGGPLISLEDGKVLGVVVRKATGLSEAFDRLNEVMKANFEALSRPQGMSMQIAGFDPIKISASLQQQMIDVARHIQRSAMVGIGYAIHISALREEPVFAS